jgi:enoyl-CoA hydratase
VSRDAEASPRSVLVSGDAVRTILLNRTETLNALDGELHEALLEALDAAAAASELRAVVLTGCGRAFSAGGDLALIRAMQDDPDVRYETLERARRLFQRFATLDVPVIAAVNGPAVGAGCTLALLCDVVFMADDAYLCDPHINVGLVPGDGGTVLWPLLAGLSAARAYLLTGDRLDAAEAHRLGLVHKVVSSANVVAESVKFAQRVAAQPRAALRETKRLLNLQLTRSAEAFELALQAESRSFETPEHRRLTRGEVDGGAQ